MKDKDEILMNDLNNTDKTKGEDKGEFNLDNSILYKFLIIAFFIFLIFIKYILLIN